MRHIKYVLLLIAPAALVKTLIFAQRAQLFEAFGWALFSCLISWIVWAYAHNNDIPSYGSMKYESGKNQPFRTIYTLVMVSIFIFGTIVA